MKILITGAGGFIGSNLAKSLANEHELLLIDQFNDGSVFANNKRKYFGSYANLIGVKAKILALNICDEAFMKAVYEFDPEVIYHFAAISDTTVYDEATVLATNLNTFYPLLNYSRSSGAKIIYASSASVYGRCEHPCKVGVDEAPINPYAFSKLKMDEAAAGFNAVGLRYFNVYGPGEFYKDSTASMALSWGLAMLKDERIVLFDDSAKARRDFVYIDDVTAINIAAINAAAGVYNVGTSKQASFLELANALEASLGLNVQKEFIENPYKASYQYSTQAVLDEVLVKSAAMRDIKEGIKAYTPHIKQLSKSISAGLLKPAFRL